MPIPTIQIAGICCSGSVAASAVDVALFVSPTGSANSSACGSELVPCTLDAAFQLLRRLSHGEGARTLLLSSGEHWTNANWNREFKAENFNLLGTSNVTIRSTSIEFLSDDYFAVTANAVNIENITFTGFACYHIFRISGKEVTILRSRFVGNNAGTVTIFLTPEKLSIIDSVIMGNSMELGKRGNSQARGLVECAMTSWLSNSSFVFTNSIFQGTIDAPTEISAMASYSLIFQTISSTAILQLLPFWVWFFLWETLRGEFSMDSGGLLFRIAPL